MPDLASLLHYGAQCAGSAFVAGLWQGTLLASAVWVCLRLAPQTTAALRFALWTAVLLSVCLLPVLETVSYGHTPRSLVHVDLRWSLALAALWLAVTLFRAGSLAWHSYSLWMLHRRAVVVPQPPALQQLLAHTPRKVQLCTSDRIDRPGVIGFFAPRILVPVWLFPQLTAPELEQIVLHELEHLRRRDDWLNLLQKLALVLFPLNPALIAVERLLCVERELACDDGVLRSTRAPRLYATCLTTLAERGLDRRAFSLALGALGDSHRRSEPKSSELGRRIHRILYRTAAVSPWTARTLTATVGVVLTCGAAGLARCPQLVAFVPATQTLAIATPLKSPALPLRTMQVVYADTQAVAPSLVKASFLPPHRPHTVRPRTHRKPNGDPLTQVRRQASTQKDPLLLTGLPEQDRPRFLTLGADLPDGGRFAVVRVDGGWLLVQL